VLSPSLLCIFGSLEAFDIQTRVKPTNPPIKFSRTIVARLRAEVPDCNGFTCQMCGLTPHDIDPTTERKVRLHIGHVVDKNLGGKDELSNLRTLCSTCNQGAKNIASEKPTWIWLLSQIRRSGQDEQLAALKRLSKKFNLPLQIAEKPGSNKKR